MNKNSFSRLIIWIFLPIIVILIVNSLSVNLQIGISTEFDSVDLPSPQADLTYQRWSAYWGKPFIDHAEDVWADQYYAYVCGTLGLNIASSKLILSRYSEWGWGWQDWNVTWTDGSPTYGKAVWGDSSYIYTAGKSSNKIVLIKWDVFGNQIWNTSWNLGGHFGDIHSIWGINDILYISGVYINDTLLIKWDDEGTQIWNQTWGGSGWEESFDVWGIENEIYTCGSTSTYGSGLNDSVIIKWNSNGDQIWNRTWGYTSEEYYTSLFGNTDGVYLCGNIWDESHTFTDIVISHWNFDGDLQWNQAWGGSEDERAYSIWVNEFYIFLCATSQSYGATYEEVVLLKWTYAGVYIESYWPTWWYNYQYIGTSIYVSHHNVYICGWYNGSEEVTGDYDQFLFNFYSYDYPPAPELFIIKPNPSLNGTFLLEWQNISETDSYNLYKDIHPILDISTRIPYQTLTNTSFIEMGLDEGTYFYVVTSVLKDTESDISNPGVVLVDYPDPPKEKIPGYKVLLLIAVLGFTSLCIIRKVVTKNK